MKAIVRFFILGVVSLSLIACGKSSEEKAQNQAQSLTTQQNSLASELNAMGTPNSSWTEARLDRYESKLSQLESVESQLRGHDGSNGVTIIGGNNSGFISRARARLAEARQEKARKSAASGQTVRIPAKPSGNSQTVSFENRIKAQASKASRKSEALFAMDKLTLTSSLEEYDDYKQALQETIDEYEILNRLIHSSESYRYSSISKLRSSVRGMLDDLKSLQKAIDTQYKLKLLSADLEESMEKARQEQEKAKQEKAQEEETETSEPMATEEESSADSEEVVSQEESSADTEEELEAEPTEVMTE